MLRSLWFLPDLYYYEIMSQILRYTLYAKYFMWVKN